MEEPARPTADETAARGFSDALLLVLGSLLAAGLGFLSLRLLLGALDAADYGRYAWFTTAAALLAVAVLWPVFSILRLGAEEVRERGRLGRTAFSVGLLVLGSCAVVGAALWWAAPWVVARAGPGRVEALSLPWWLGAELGSAGWLWLFVALGGAGGVFLELLKPAGKVGLRTLASALGRAVTLLLLWVVLRAVGRLDLGTTYACLCAGGLATVLLPLSRLLPWLSGPALDGEVVRRSVLFGGPVALRFLGVAGLATVDVFVLERMLGLEAVARYAVAYQIAEQVVVLGFVLEHAAGPILAARAAAAEPGAAEGYLRLVVPQLTWAWALGAALLIPLAVPLLGLLRAHDPAGSGLVLQLLLLGVALRGVTLLENPLLDAHLLSFWPTAFLLVALGLNLGLDVALVPSFGILGPALATLAAFGLQAALRALYLRRRFPGAGSWLPHLSLVLPLLVLGATLRGGVPGGLVAWSLLGLGVLCFGRRLGLFPPAARALIERVRLPGPLRRALLALHAPAVGVPVFPDVTPDPARKRLLLLTTELLPAGAERVVMDLALGLDPACWQVVVASLRSPGGEDGAIADALRARGIPVALLRMRGKLDVIRTLGLVRLCRSFRPHVLHAHLFHANLAARLLGRRGGAGRIVCSHHVVERRRLPLRFLVERWTAGRDDATVCVSEAVARFARERLGAKDPQVSVIPDGVDLARFAGGTDAAAARAALGLPAEGLLLGGVGRLDRQKGWDVLLRAFAQLAPDHARAHLAIAGRGPEEGVLRAMIDGLGLAGRVTLLGFREDVPRVLAALDLVAIPSRWEGFGLVAVEALAAARPIVASAVDSLPEVLGDAALLVPPDDPGALADALKGLLADPTRRAALAGLGPARASRFELRAMLAAHETLYSRLVV